MVDTWIIGKSARSSAVSKSYRIESFELDPALKRTFTNDVLLGVHTEEIYE